MKGFLKLTIIVAVLYFAYKYYVKNYTEKGLADAEQQKKKDDAPIIAKGNQLREEARQEGYEVCNQIPDMPTPSGMVSNEPLRQQCRGTLDAQLEEVDWYNEALAYF